MREGNFPKCGSREIYTSDSPYPETLYVKSTTPSLEMFTTCAYIGVDCRHWEMCVNDTSIALFGKGKRLKESLPAVAIG